jgi:hypothetical protein
LKKIFASIVSNCRSNSALLVADLQNTVELIGYVVKSSKKVNPACLQAAPGAGGDRRRGRL